MLYHRILLIVLLACVAAHSRSAAGQPGESSTNLPPTLKARLSALGADVKVSGARNNDNNATNSTAGIYATKEVPSLKDLLPPLDPAMKISEQTEGNRTSVICAWPDVTVRFTVQPEWNAAIEQMAMKNWVTALAGSDANSLPVALLLHKVDGTMACIGTVITPRYDSAGKASALVCELAAKLDGYVFSRNAFYSAAGDKIVGVTNAPSKL